MILNIHAGHNPDGKVACGAVGLIKESTEARAVKDLVITELRKLKHTVYDCTVDDGKNANDVLKKIIAKCNQRNVDLDVSIHFNAGRSDKTGDNKVGGVEVLIYDKTTKAYDYAIKVCDAIKELGMTNRGVKLRPDLYFLNSTKAPAILIECCFVDDADDIKLYNRETMASAIVKGLTGVNTTPSTTTVTNTSTKNDFDIARETLIKLGITDGSRPENTVTRKEVWAMLYRIIDKYNLK